jgi:hypothetical protein
MKLYEIRQDLEFILDNLEVNEETGEISPESTRVLDQVEKSMEEKALNVAKFIKNIKSEADAVREEEKRLASRRRALDNKVEYWKNYLAHNIKGEKYKDSQVVIGWRKSTSVGGESLNMPESLPREFQRITIEPMKRELTKALKNGQVIPGVQLIENTSLTIK